MKDQFDFDLDTSWNDGVPISICLKAPSDDEVLDGWTKIGLSLFSSHYTATSGISIAAEMSVEQAEKLALKILHACSVVRISAKEQKVKIK